MHPQQLVVSWFSLVLLTSPIVAIWELEKNEPKAKSFLKCEAKDYSGHFTCWWLTAISTDLKFSVKSSRGSSDPRGVTCGAASLSTEKVIVDHREYKKYTVECQEGSACPAAEESLPIEVVVEVSWEYPDTWSTPHSYFSLTFCVQVQGKNKREKKLFMDQTSAKVTCHKDASIRVQARDRYYNSFWSEWASVSCSQ
ncbi:IL12B, partial [Cervus elaphus hippelaphus]